MPMFLVSGNSGDMDVSAFVEAYDRDSALDMHADFIMEKYDVAGNQLDCPRNVWAVPTAHGEWKVLEFVKDVMLTAGRDPFYKEGDDIDNAPANHGVATDRYVVIIEATRTLEIAVDAVDANKAREMASDIYTQSTDYSEFTETDFDWEIKNVDME